MMVVVCGSVRDVKAVGCEFSRRAVCLAGNFFFGWVIDSGDVVVPSRGALLGYSRRFM